MTLAEGASSEMRELTPVRFAGFILGSPRTSTAVKRTETTVCGLST